MLSNTVLGCFVFIITNLSLLYASHLIVRRYLSEFPPAVRLVATMLFFYSWIILIFQTLSPFYAISRLWVSVTCCLIAFLAHILFSRHRNIYAEFAPLKSWIGTGLSSRWCALLLICGFVVFISITRALLMPPLAWDCLTYHLTFAALWIKKGALIFFRAPDQITTAAFMPINGELFSAWLLLPFQTDLLANLMNFPITFLGGLACYGLARELGLSRRSASWAPALICFIPAIYAQITTGYVDNAVLAFYCAAVLFSMRYLLSGNVRDCMLALLAAGILLGIKYTAIPAVALVLTAIIAKTVYHPQPHRHWARKIIVISLGIVIIVLLGGRKYIQNTVESGNPCFPFPVRLFGQELCAGWSKFYELEQETADKTSQSEFIRPSLWDKMYGMFFDRKMSPYPLSAGPKVFLFFFLACISFFFKPHNVTRRCWYFLSVAWSIPYIFTLFNESGKVAEEAVIQVNTRYFSASIAIFTVQGLVLLGRLSSQLKKIDYFIMLLIAYDLFWTNKEHLWEIHVLYPYIALTAPLMIILIIFIIKKLKAVDLASGHTRLGLARPGFGTRGLAFMVIFFSCFAATACLLQEYRDLTRYTYYRYHLDFHTFPRFCVDGWEFLDRPEHKKTVALAVDAEPWEHYWFFYPLLGRSLQNDAVYISAQHKWDVPAWLEGESNKKANEATWLDNLRRQSVDYIFVFSKPVELTWIRKNSDLFRIVFDAEQFKIFAYQRLESS